MRHGCLLALPATPISWSPPTMSDLETDKTIVVRSPTSGGTRTSGPDATQGLSPGPARLPARPAAKCASSAGRTGARRRSIKNEPPFEGRLGGRDGTDGAEAVQG